MIVCQVQHCSVFGGLLSSSLLFIHELCVLCMISVNLSIILFYVVQLSVLCMINKYFDVDEVYFPFLIIIIIIIMLLPNNL